jgi:hypothetical protein
MTKHLAIYMVFAKDDEVLDTDTLVFVKEGWSWGAAIFNVFWAAYHSIWRVFFVLLVLQIGITLLGVPEDPFKRDLYTVLKLGILLFAGCNGADWHMQSLKRKGYRCMDVVSGYDQADAQYKFLSHYLATTNPSSVTA